METIRTTYIGQLRTEAIHVQSGNRLLTDAPIDNHGKGETFSPTDLLATSLASCIFTIMGIKAEASGFSIDGATAKTWKIMSEDPRRVAEVKIEYDFTMCDLNDKQKKILQSLVKVSPVPLSLHPETNQNISITFKD
ncbi:MAG: osmotically inducible protein OsmC [Bacteroidetes bacterium GWC2_33_15]|nr:MAG: osmotically inducible protein OsmC [Bacteroidetes bacterium GWA2_33_15]OFX49192.1 MAG: osmotically inducible protein OsmC [Bacteroidetes bacterium GWC2_33_15]OFX64661.1 MAG: osmotically inducible protein OsmC [Bacteroidetes bacterium GWB2_32_14]OFX69131.1 MAG: osmotically inducible protein OsmC [Bacteroidetes bacterium GWD2_33_33]HAN17639.1 osmotically inducible protein OsmC [Bacteroidales bacterium]